MISILLASYGDQSQRYLDLCFASLRAQTFKDFEIIQVSSGAFKPMSQADMHIHLPTQTHYPQAIQTAFEHSDPKREFIVFCNDDVIVQKDTLQNMLSWAQSGPFMINALSNCDHQRFYLYAMPFQKLQYRIDEMESMYDGVIDCEIYKPFLGLWEMCHLYFTIMKRADFVKIGGMDVAYRTGYDDKCLSKRATEIGVRPAFITNGFVLHASGVSADLYLTNEDRQFNFEYFNKKHGVTK